jgi:hypothetical protein
MESYRQNLDDEAESLKSGHLVLDKLRALYQRFDRDERKMADQVLGEWMLSPDEAVCYDARALINDQGITSAVPALRALANRLSGMTGRAAKYELKAVNRLLKKLASSQPSR